MDMQMSNRRGQHKHGTMPVTRIGLEPNETYMTDVALPTLQTYRDTELVSFDWKILFVSIYKEQHQISLENIARTITSPSMIHLPTEYPIIITAERHHHHQSIDTEDF